MAQKMQGQQGKREKSLTRDTSISLQHTCHGLRELAEHLLKSGQKYVLQGEFTTDYLETKFGELRQGSGGCYFITVQNIIEKLRIHRTRLVLDLTKEIPDEKSDHACSKCNYILDEEACILFESLSD